MTDEFNISMTVDGLYKLEFGTQDEMDIKIRIAAAVLPSGHSYAPHGVYVPSDSVCRSKYI